MAGSIVQSRETSVSGSSSTTIGLAFAGGNTAANGIWVVAHGGAAALTATCADTAGNTYGAALNTISDTDNSNTVVHFYVPNCAAGANTVTVTFSSSVDFRCIYICEVGGITTNVAQGNNGRHQNAVNNAADALTSNTASNANTSIQLSLSCEDGGGLAPTAGTGFTQDIKAWSFGGGAGANTATIEFRVGLAATTSEATFTGAQAFNYPNTVMVLLRESGGAAAAPFSGDDFTMPGRVPAQNLQAVQGSLALLTAQQISQILMGQACL